MPENKNPPIPKPRPKKGYVPMYEKKVYEEHKDACKGLAGSKLDGCVSSILEGTPSIFKIPKGVEVEAAKGGVIQKKHMAKKPKAKMMGGGMYGGGEYKKPQMKHGGVHKGKKYAYAAGGMVKDINMMRSK